MRISDFYTGVVVEPDVKDVFNQYEGNEVVADVENEKFYKLVFAPDPETGNPNSDVLYLLKGTDEGFKQFIKEKLFQRNPEASLAETPEEAEALIKKNVWTVSEFEEVAKDYVTKMMQEDVATD